MKTITIDNPLNLIIQLENLHNQGGYIFRGQSAAIYPLIPNMLRENTLKKSAEKFPISKNEIENNWFVDPVVKNLCEICLKSSFEKKVLHLLPLLRLLIYIIRGNYELYKFWKSEKSLPIHIKNRLNQCPENFWIRKEIFLCRFGNIFLKLIERRSLKDGSLIQKAYIDEELAGIDETFPQHYGVPTAALDWSYNPFVALYFALDIKVESISNSIIVRAKKMPPSYISIYAYKQLDNIKDSYVYIMDKDKIIPSIRLERQEGTFTYFSKPCSFYLDYCKFPSVEDYDTRFEKGYEKRTFELIKFNIRYSEANVNYFKPYLEERGITEPYLFPDKEETVVSSVIEIV